MEFAGAVSSVAVDPRPRTLLALLLVVVLVVEEVADQFLAAAASPVLPGVTVESGSTAAWPL